jgi:hypothetical protein
MRSLSEAIKLEGENEMNQWQTGTDRIGEVDFVGQHCTGWIDCQ